MIKLVLKELQQILHCRDYWHCTCVVIWWV